MLWPINTSLRSLALAFELWRLWQSVCLILFLYKLV
jgi:hypothetical protein